MKAFHGAQNGAVNHYRHDAIVVFANVRCAQTAPAKNRSCTFHIAMRDQTIMQGKFNFRSVEGALARLVLERNAVLDGAAARSSSARVHVASRCRWRQARGRLDVILLQAEGTHARLRKTVRMRSFTSARTCSSVQKMWGVILREAALSGRAGNPKARCGVAAAEFAHAQQIAVRLQALVEDLHVTQAVPRLDAVFTAVFDAVVNMASL